MSPLTLPRFMHRTSPKAEYWNRTGWSFRGARGNRVQLAMGFQKENPSPSRGPSAGD